MYLIVSRKVVVSGLPQSRVSVNYSMSKIDPSCRLSSKPSRSEKRNETFRLENRNQTCRFCLSNLDTINPGSKDFETKSVIVCKLCKRKTEVPVILKIEKKTSIIDLEEPFPSKKKKKGKKDTNAGLLIPTSSSSGSQVQINSQTQLGSGSKAQSKYQTQPGSGSKVQINNQTQPGFGSKVQSKYQTQPGSGSQVQSKYQTQPGSGPKAPNLKKSQNKDKLKQLLNPGKVEGNQTKLQGFLKLLWDRTKLSSGSNNVFFVSLFN